MPTLGDGEVLFAVHIISLDPTMRNAMAGDEAAERTEGSSYYTMMNWTPGQVINWYAVAQVVESKSADFDVGDMVMGMAPLRKFFTTPTTQQFKKLPPGIPPETIMASMGVTAMTGYLGAKYTGCPKAGETVFVSGAAGATGLVACQTFKALGCNVFGSAGTDQKVSLLQSLGIQAFNYKNETYLSGMRRLCPQGFDVAFDNVGGECLEAMLEMVNEFGRIVLCGAISQYDTPPEQKHGIRNLFHAIAKQVHIKGILVYGFTAEQQEDCQNTLTQWMQDGTVQDTSTIIEGFDEFPDALMGLFAGKNTGKMMVREALPICNSKISTLDQPGASAAAAVAAEPRIADKARAEHETVQTAAAQIELLSARIVDQSGKFYTIEIHSTDQQNVDFALRKLTRRYREFAALDTELRPRHQALPTLPEKSVFFRRTFKHGFMDDRERRLDAYLSALVADPAAVAEPSVQRFLGVECRA